MLLVEYRIVLKSCYLIFEARPLFPSDRKRGESYDSYTPFFDSPKKNLQFLEKFDRIPVEVVSKERRSCGGHVGATPADFGLREVLEKGV